jgi:Protein of unknown function (DUF3489)
VIDVVTAVTTAAGACIMTTSTVENREHVTAPEPPEPPKRAKGAAPKPRVAPAKAKPAHKDSQAKKAAKAATAPRVRQGSKTAKVLTLLQQSGGVTLKRLMKATGWQPHSVRGFLSGTLGKKMGLRIESRKTHDGERIYSVGK